MKIAIISDVHDNWKSLEKAVVLANEKGCDHLLFAGDLVSPPMIPFLGKFNGKVLTVWGNNESEKIGIQNQVNKNPNVSMPQDFVELTLDGVRIFMNHYPKYAELAAKSGEYDLVIYGHTHVYEERKTGECLIINPGEITGYATGTSTMVIFDTAEKTAQKEVINP